MQLSQDRRWLFPPPVNELFWQFLLCALLLLIKQICLNKRTKNTSLFYIYILRRQKNNFLVASVLS